MSIGFIGTGTIATALVTGLCEVGKYKGDIYLSPRNEEKAKKLAGKYNNVFVCANNQDVADKSNIVMLSVLPKLADEIISPIEFRPDHKIVSVMSDCSVSRVRELVGNVESVTRILPLPFCARGIGPIVVYPQNKEIADLFSGIGDIISTDDENSMGVMFAITGVMSSFYALTWEIVSWGEGEGLTRQESLDYTASFFEALCIQAKGAENGDVSRLANEYTPGGLNEMALLRIRDKDNALKPWINALDAIQERLNSK